MIEALDFEQIISWAKELQGLSKPNSEWYEEFGIDPAKINHYDAKETFRFFVLSMFHQGAGDDTVRKKLGNGRLDVIANYNKLKEGIKEGMKKCHCLKSRIDFQYCDYRKPRARNIHACSSLYENCPVILVGNQISHMKTSELAKGIISAVIFLSEKWQDDLNNIWREAKKVGGLEGSELLIQELKWIRSVSDKIAHMFCAFMANPDTEWKITAWKDGIDWTHFIVIDKIIFRILNRMGLIPRNDYRASLYVLRNFAKKINLTKLLENSGKKYEIFNPRILELSLWYFGREKDELENKQGFCVSEPNCFECLVSENCPKIRISEQKKTIRI